MSVFQTEGVRVEVCASTLMLSPAEGYGVLLDHRKLRTPQKELLVVPTEPLAQAVAGEWASQGSLLQPSIMHLVSPLPGYN